MFNFVKEPFRRLADIVTGSNTYYRRGLEELKERNFPKAIELISKGLEPKVFFHIDQVNLLSSSEDRRALYHRGIAYLNQGDGKQAMDDFQRAFSIETTDEKPDPTLTDLLVCSGYASVLNEDTKSATGYSNEAIGRGYESEVIFLYRGIATISQCVEDFNHELKTISKNHSDFNEKSKGERWEIIKKESEILNLAPDVHRIAIEDFKRAIEINPLSIAHGYLADSYHAIGETDNAKHHYEEFQEAVKASSMPKEWIKNSLRHSTERLKMEQEDYGDKPFLKEMLLVYFTRLDTPSEILQLEHLIPK